MNSRKMPYICWKRPKLIFLLSISVLLLSLIIIVSRIIDIQRQLKNKNIQHFEQNDIKAVIALREQVTPASAVVLQDTTAIPVSQYVTGTIPNNGTTQNVTMTTQFTFGPEKGLYNFTVVTAMLDIGRGSWKKQNRGYDQYLLYMTNVLKLDINLVIFADSRARSFIARMRQGREKHTKIINTTLVDLPYYRYRDRMAEIMNSSEYKKDNQLVEQKLCESYIPEYDILQLSKLYFMNRTVWENPFSTSYFMWIDGGYAHGHDVFPKNFLWFPQNLFEFSDKVTFMERHPGVKAFENKTDNLHKLSINILAGNFFAGGSGALKELCEMQRHLVDEWMKKGVVDDDQTMYMLMYYKKPSLFHLVSADWYDVFKKFNVQ